MHVIPLENIALSTKRYKTVQLYFGRKKLLQISTFLYVYGWTYIHIYIHLYIYTCILGLFVLRFFFTTTETVYRK